MGLVAGDWGLGNPISHRYPNRQRWISVSVDSEVLICKYQYGALFDIAATGNRPFSARYARLLGVVKGKWGDVLPRGVAGVLTKLRMIRVV